MSSLNTSGSGIKGVDIRMITCLITRRLNGKTIEQQPYRHQ
jgi:hypothetical protein